MIVECPRCRARYRVEADLLDRDQTFKCSRCGHVFAYEAEVEAETDPTEHLPAPAPSAPQLAPLGEPPVIAGPEITGQPTLETRSTPSRRDADSLSFSFSESVANEARSAADHPTSATTPKRPRRNEEEDFSFRDEEEPFGSSPRDDEPFDEQPRFVRGEDELRIEEDETAPDPTRPYLIFLGVLVIVYAIVALDLLNHPARAEGLLATVPVVGDVLAQDHLLQIRVQLDGVAGAYQHIKDDKMVFIVSGRAVNTSNEALNGVQIESSLYDTAGRPLETKSIYCGNAMSLKIVKDLSAKEISLLQRLEPPKRFEIRPGESAGFSVVFLAPPNGVKEFTTRVVAAQASSAS